MEELLKRLFDRKTVLVLSYLQGRKSLQIRETAREINIPVATVFRIFKKLESIELIKGIPVGAFKIYTVNNASKAYALVEKLIPKLKPLELFTKEILANKVEQVLLLDEGEDRASIMVIGEVKQSRAQEITEKIKAEHAFSIKALVLSQSQYDNLEALSAKPVPKRTLYKK